MTEKNKRQLRAEAMERLKNNVGARFMPDAAIIAIVGGRVGQSDWSLECDKIIDLLTDDDSHEERESYEERMYDVPVSDCPYCGCARVVIHDYNDSYERPHSYRVEHVSEKEAFNEGCFTSYYAFDSVEKAVQHADERNEWRCIGECADANDTLSAENDVSEASMDANDVNADTREKLEADVQKYLDLPANCRGWGDYKTVCEWLDRQAAITDSECRSEFDALDEHAQALERESAELKAKLGQMTVERDILQDCVDDLNADTSELQAKVDELTEQRDRWRSNWTGRNMAYSELADDYQELEAKVDELTAELERETLMACNTCAARIDLEQKVDELEDKLQFIDQVVSYVMDGATFTAKSENGKTLKLALVDTEGNVIS